MINYMMMSKVTPSRPVEFLEHWSWPPLPYDLSNSREEETEEVVEEVNMVPLSVGSCIYEKLKIENQQIEGQVTLLIIIIIEGLYLRT